MQYREIELTQDKWAVIDALDYALVKPFTWYAQRVGNTWYAQSSRWKLPPLLMHRLIMVPPDHLEVDHIDRNGLFNSRSNLRWATHAQNIRNSVVPQTEFGSGYRGVTAHRSKWQARIKVNGVQLVLGTHDTPELAARVYDEAARLHHGRFAVLNFPLDEFP